MVRATNNKQKFGNNEGTFLGVKIQMHIFGNATTSTTNTKGQRNVHCTTGNIYNLDL